MGDKQEKGFSGNGGETTSYKRLGSGLTVKPTASELGVWNLQFEIEGFQKFLLKLI